MTFVETPLGSSSGLLIHDGYIVTNAHVVWPYDQARIVFPDGSEFLDVPVLAFDPLSDLAVLGPLDVGLDPSELRNGEDLVIGSEVRLVGYPAESESFPQPTITRGVLSRLRQWEALGMTYFQTDASIAGGQSGGALISTKGEVIGVSGFRFSDVGFGLVGSASDISTIIEKLILGEVNALGDRSLPHQGSRKEFTVNLRSNSDRRVFLIDEKVGTTINLEVEGEADGIFTLNDSQGFRILLVDNRFSGIETENIDLEIDAPYFFKVGLASGDSGQLNIKSSSGLAIMEDPDDGLEIFSGETIMASLDFPRDTDYFTIQLEKGQTVTITAQSLNVDTVLNVDFHGSRENQNVFDRDSGGGLFGTDAELIYQAPKTGNYFVAVSNEAVASHGGYFLSVRDAPADANPVIIPQSPDLVESPFGTMMVYQSLDHEFSVQVPADWIDGFGTIGANLEMSSPDGATVSIVEEDIDSLGASTNTLDDYTDLIESVVVSISPGTAIVSRKRIQTLQGLPADLLELSAFNGLFRANRFIYVDEDGIAFNITYFYPSETFDSAENLIQYSIGSFLTSDSGLTQSQETTTAPPPAGATRRVPVEIGVGLTVSDFTSVFTEGKHTARITVIEVIRGDEAWSRIFKANQFNDPSDAGMEYILAKIRFEYLEGPDINEPFSIEPIEFRLSSDWPKFVAPPDSIPPDPELRGDVLPGESREGWFIKQVPVDDATPVVGIAQDLLGNGGGWWALYPPTP